MAQPQSLSTAKIALYGACALAVIGILYIASQQMFAEKPLSLTLPRTAVKQVNTIPRALPQAVVEPIEPPITKFPDQFYRMVTNGHMSSLEGRKLCVIGQSLPMPKDCDELSERVVRTVKDFYPSLYKSEMKKVGTLDYGGYLMKTSDPNPAIKGVTFAVDPKKALNFKKTLNYVDKVVLENPRAFFSQSSSYIEKTLVKTHQILLQGSQEKSGLVESSYRTLCSFVTRRSNHEVDGLMRLIRENGGEAEMQELFQNIRERISQDGTEELCRILNEEEIATFQKYLGYMPPAPEKIPQLMDSLVSKLKVFGNEILEGNGDVVDAASTMHCEIGNIHPFEDGNGRLARLWMNILLQLGGKPAVVFPDDDAYTDAIVQEQAGVVGAFREFLKKTIQWNHEAKIHTLLRA